MMSGRTIVTLVASVTTLVATRGVAQTDEVRAAMMETVAAWSRGDFDRFAEFYHPDARGFLFDGGRLVRGFNKAALLAAYDAGFRTAMEVREIDVRVFGDVAVATALAEGSITLPGGVTETGSWRYSEVRIRAGRTWQIVQYHFSRMTVPGR